MQIVNPFNKVVMNVNVKKIAIIATVAVVGVVAAAVIGTNIANNQNEGVVDETVEQQVEETAAEIETAVEG